MTLEGKYRFGRYNSFWGVWELDSNSGIFRIVKVLKTYEEAVREVYRLNGWGDPKTY